MTQLSKQFRNSLCVILMICLIFTMFPIVGGGVNGFGNGQVYAASASDLTGDQRADIVKIAKSCEGMTLAKTKDQLKKYGKKLWNESYNGDWCAWFISNCAVEAGVKKSVFPRSTVAGTSTFGSYKAKGKYTPKPGDVALFGAPGSTYHVELVYSVKNGTVKTIGGNTGGNSWPYSIVSKPQAKSGIYGYVPIQYTAAKANHTFSYSLNGGSGSFSSVTVKEGDSLKIPSTKPTRKGYDFQGFYAKRLADQTWYVADSGWVAEKNLSGKTRKLYQPGGSYLINSSWTKGSAKSNYTLYAQWKLRQEFTLKFNANTGTGSMPQKTIKLTGGSITFDTVNQFRKDGYEMNGWKVQRIALDGSEYWIVPNGNSWTWKKNAAVSERKLYRYTDRLTFGANGISAGDTIVIWASWKAVPAGKQSIEDGTYHIISALDPSCGMNIYNAGTADGTNIGLYRNTQDAAQTFDVNYLGNGYYSIVSAYSGKSLEVRGSQQYNKANVQIWKNNGTDNQKWIIHDMGNGYFSIISKCNGLLVNVEGGKTADYTNISMYQSNGSLAQSWGFLPVEEEINESDEEDIAIAEDETPIDEEENVIIEEDNATDEESTQIVIEDIPAAEEDDSAESEMIIDQQAQIVDELGQKAIDAEETVNELEERIRELENQLAKLAKEIEEAQNQANKVEENEETEEEVVPDTNTNVTGLLEEQTDTQAELAEVEQKKEEAESNLEQAIKEKDTEEKKLEKVIKEAEKKESAAKAVSLSEADIAGISARTYTGKAQTQEPVLTIDGEELTNGADYTVYYFNNVNIGTASMVISGKGKYNGSLEISFPINPKGTSIKKISKGKKKMTVKWNKQKKQTSGYQIRFSMDDNFNTDVKIVTVNNAKTTKKVIKKLKAKKTYYVQVRTFKKVSGNNYYSEWSATKSVKTK